jgi:multisubunit Na+/H+ antiporter MnhF subunit
VRGAGGTPGGIGTFLAGSAMVVAGGYLLLTRVTVTSGLWELWGYNAFGLSLVPLLVGIGLLFFDGRSLPGWLLTAAGALIILVGIIANLRVYFRATSLFDTLLILGLLAGGLGLVARSLRAQGSGTTGSYPAAG